MGVAGPEADKESGNTSIKFHEGMHGNDYLDFLESNPLPKFEPGKEPFMAAAKKYKEALEQIPRRSD